MILDATSLSHYQMCARRSALELRWRIPRLRPKLLFERYLRQGISALSTVKPPPLDDLIRDVKAQFLGQCANPGLDLAPGSNPFIIAKDWAIALEMALRAASRLSLLTLNPVASVALSPSVSWKVSSLADDSTVLHRWLACDRWDQDELSRQAHGWWVFGDMAATRRSMMLHIVEIGQIRNGRRDSCWTRGFRHRFAPNLPLKFKKPTDAKQGDYLSEYLADSRTRDAEKWIDTLIAEGLVQKHIHHVTLECPSDEVCADTVVQMLKLAEEMRSLEVSSRAGELWSSVPMSRSACDGMVPCQWQGVCYQYPPPDPEDVGALLRSEEAAQSGARVRKIPVVPAATAPDARR
jgi:hypothetical protein